MEEQNKMSKKEFWIRFAIWAVFALILPVAFIAWRYGIFTSKTGLTGGGIIVVLIFTIFAISLVKNVKEGLEPGSMALQCINGFTWIIPLIGLAAIIKIAENNLLAFEQTLVVIIICEIIAIPVDPTPKWKAQNKIEKQTSILQSVMQVISKGDKK